eukprot:4478531-Pleurochrysis_carterae.AAC.3
MPETVAVRSSLTLTRTAFPIYSCIACVLAERSCSAYHPLDPPLAHRRHRPRAPRPIPAL